MIWKERYIFGYRRPGALVRHLYLPLVMLAAVFLVLACKDNKHPYAKFEPPARHDAVDSNAIYAVVEIPAGTTMLQRLDTASMEIVAPDDGAIDFLPAPGNLGFVSSTLLAGSDRPVEVVVMMHALAPGSVVQVLPIGVLQLQEKGSTRDIVVAIPTDPELQSIRVSRFVDFITEYETARYILQEWFVNYKGFGALTLVGWQDERHALQLIESNRLQPR